MNKIFPELLCVAGLSSLLYGTWILASWLMFVLLGLCLLAVGGNLSLRIKK